MKSANQTVIALLLLSASAIYAVGVVAERSHRPSDDGTLSGESMSDSHNDLNHNKRVQETNSHLTEGTLLGVSLESPVVIASVFVTSIILAAAATFWATRMVLVATMTFALIFALFDLRESIFQTRASNTGLALAIVFTGVLHLAAAWAAALSMIGGRHRLSSTCSVTADRIRPDQGASG